MSGGEKDVVCNTDEGGKRGSGKTKSGKDASAERLQGMQGAILHQQKRYLVIVKTLAFR